RVPGPAPGGTGAAWPGRGGGRPPTPRPPGSPATPGCPPRPPPPGPGPGRGPPPRGARSTPPSRSSSPACSARSRPCSAGEPRLEGSPMSDRPGDSPGVATARRAFFVLGSIGLVVAALYLGQRIFVPLALAVLLTPVLRPVVIWLERRGPPGVPPGPVAPHPSPPPLRLGRG